MTQQTHGTPERKYSKEIQDELYEALKEAKILLNLEGYDENSIVVGMIDKAIALVEVK